MNNDRLLLVGSPCFFLTQQAPSDFTNWGLQVATRLPRFAVRTIRGKKSRTVPVFFDEISAALQFPYYFGENWNAFSECITDLDWLPADGYLLLISEGQLLLDQAQVEEWRTLIRAFTQANVEWTRPNEYFPRERPATPFHVVVQGETAETMAYLERRLTEAQGVFERL